jgi:tripartite motif-containing protein 71
MNPPFGVALSSAGDIYVSDTLNDRVQELSPTGKPLLQWGSKGSAPGQFDGPTGLAIDAYGDVYIADTANSRIEKFSPVGHLLAVWGKRGY